jgi:hypothetical protein
MRLLEVVLFLKQPVGETTLLLRISDWPIETKDETAEKPENRI